MRELKFLTDSMCGRLTRLLRIFAYDTIYANDLIELFNLDPVPDDKLLEFALKEDRIIITKDNAFYRKARDRSIFLEGEDAYNYLNQLKAKLGLNYDFNIQRARCSVCNSNLKKIDKELIKEEVRAETFKYQDNFFRCKNPKCRKIYWKGSHIDNIMNKLEKQKNF